jgi:hypothetical protein
VAFKKFYPEEYFKRTGMKVPGVKYSKQVPEPIFSRPKSVYQQSRNETSQDRRSLSNNSVAQSKTFYSNNMRKADLKPDVERFNESLYDFKKYLAAASQKRMLKNPYLTK